MQPLGCSVEGRKMNDETFSTPSLHVPEPEVRPGDVPDFSRAVIPKAGSVDLPPVDVDPKEILPVLSSCSTVVSQLHGIPEWNAPAGPRLGRGSWHLRKKQFPDVKLQYPTLYIKLSHGCRRYLYLATKNEVARTRPLS